MDEKEYVATKQGCEVAMKATNMADAQYRYENEVVYNREFKFTGTRQEFLDWYVGAHVFQLPPPSEW
jgi:hypothetical protein